MSITNKLKKRKIKVKKKKSYNSYKFDYKKSFFFNIYLRSIFYFKIYTYIKKCLFNNKKNLRYLKRWFFVKLLRIFFATTPHNFFMSLHKINGDILFYTSSGMHGFKSKRKLNHSAANELGRFLVLQFKKKKNDIFCFFILAV